MNNDYLIVNTNNESDIKYMVIATSYVSPFDTIEQLEKDFNELKYVGNVLFELLLCNGLAPNRFVTCYFNGERFNILDSNVVNADDKYKEVTCRLIKDNSTWLERSILPGPQKYLLKNGYVF